MSDSPSYSSTPRTTKPKGSIDRLVELIQQKNEIEQELEKLQSNPEIVKALKSLGFEKIK